jgi:hypothetical protein
MSKERRKERKKNIDLCVLAVIFVSRVTEFDPSATLSFKFQMLSKTKWSFKFVKPFKYIRDRVHVTN